jgi:hypothetical protein
MFLVGPPMPEGAKGSGQLKCSLSSSRLDIGLAYPPPKILPLQNLQRKRPQRRPRPIQGCSATKEKESYESGVGVLIGKGPIVRFISVFGTVFLIQAKLGSQLHDFHLT